MIVAFTGTDDVAASELAQQLALLRTAAGGKVLLASAHQAAQLERRRAYDDVVIDSGNADSLALAMAIASVIVVLIRPGDVHAAGRLALQVRLKRACEVNPAARVLVSVAGEHQDLSPHDVGSLLVFVAQIGAARLADMLVLDEHGVYHTRHSEFEPTASKHGESLYPPEIKHLYRQVFQVAR